MLNFECSMFNGKQKAEVIQLHLTISMTCGQLKDLDSSDVFWSSEVFYTSNQNLLRSVAWSGSWHHSHIESIFHSCHNSRFKLASSLRSTSYGSWTSELTTVEQEKNRSSSNQPLENLSERRFFWKLNLWTENDWTEKHRSSFKDCLCKIPQKDGVFYWTTANSPTHKRLNRKSGVQAGAWTPDFFYLSNIIFFCAKVCLPARNW
jgi:hypothetical protein